MNIYCQFRGGIAMKWGEALRKIREKRQMTIRQVCEKTSGISASFLSQLETGKRSIDEATLEQLLQVYDITQAEFITYCKKENGSFNIKPINLLPVLDMAKVKFDDFWNAKDKMFNSIIVKEQIGSGGIGDPRAFALEVSHLEMADCGVNVGDYLIITPRIEASSGEIGLILIRDTNEIFIRKVFHRGDNLIRLVSEDPTKEERLIDRTKTEIKIYFIDSVQKKQKRIRKRKDR